MWGVVLGCLLAGVGCLAQTPPYGNEWINPAQTYLRIPIAKTGWYQITSQDLAQAGLDVAQLPTRSLQLFRRGQEIALLVNGESDGHLDPQDTIEFFAETNNGLTDTSLYISPEAMPHPHYSLYSDTAAYFLTWRLDQRPGLRMQAMPATPVATTAAVEPHRYHVQSVLQVFTNEYPAGNLYPMGAWYDNGSALTAYDIGEGWTGPTRRKDQWHTYTLSPENLATESKAPIRVEALLVGRFSGKHVVEVWLGTAQRQDSLLTTLRWNDYTTAHFAYQFEALDLSTLRRLDLSFVSREPNDSYSVSYLKWQYPQRLSPSQLPPQKEYYFEQNAPLPSELAEGNARWYNITQPLHPNFLANPPQPLPAQSRWIAVRQPLSIPKPRLVRFRALEPRDYDYLLISHPRVRQPIGASLDPVADYAAYRASPQGGQHRPLVMNAEEVFDHFNYGDRSPLAIRSLALWLHEQGQLRHVFLIGQSRDPQTARKMAAQWNEDMIPNAGWPGSDIALMMGLDRTRPHRLLVPIGRISATGSQQVWDYLQKVKQLEAQPTAAPWRKNVLHISGGTSAQELRTFRNFIDDFTKKWKEKYLAPHIRTLSKQAASPVENLDITPLVNEGVALITMFGHSSLSVADIDIGLATDPNRGYANAPRYPALWVNGCASGNIYFHLPTLSNDWILAPNKGGVLFVAHTHNGLSSSLKRYTDQFYEVFADTAFTNQSFGAVVQEAIGRYLVRYPFLTDRITAEQMTLQGDPAIVLFPARRPDYSWVENSLRLTDENERPITSQSSAMRLKGVVINHGRYRNEDYTIRIQRKKYGEIVQEWDITQPTRPLFDTLDVLLPFVAYQEGEEEWQVAIDPEHTLLEENKENNQAALWVWIPQGGAFPLLPTLNERVVAPSNVLLVAQLPSARVGESITFEWGWRADFVGASTRTLPTTHEIVRLSITIPSDTIRKVYWRVKLSQDRPSLPSSFWLDPSPPTAELLPEAIVRVAAAYAPEVVEGGIFAPTLLVENISSVAFTDSVEVTIRVISPTQAPVQWRQMIPPLLGQDTYSFSYPIATLGQVGEHRVFLHFNSQKLPEKVWSNNFIELRITVLPDRVAPLLSVQFDGRTLQQDEVVAAQPTLQVVLMDNNPFVLPTDTTAFRLWLQPLCEGCGELPLSLASAQRHTLLSQRQVDLTLRLPTPLPEGRYQLRVEGQDYFGNQAAPYRIRFRVVRSRQITGAEVSPIPSASWVRFRLMLEGPSPPPLWRIRVYDLTGKQVAQLETRPHLGINELYWEPSPKPSGMYLYRMELPDTPSEEWPKTAEAEAGLSGKLLWN